MMLARMLLCFCLLSLSPDFAAEELTIDNRTYAGLNVSQWHERLKDIDPKSANAAVVVEPLIEIVANDNLPGVDREPFAAFLARVGEPARRVVPILASMINHRHEDSAPDYLWAARALALMGEPAREATPALVELLFDERIPVSHRQSPVEALALIGTAHPDALPALLRLLQYRVTPNINGSDAAFMRRLAAESFAIIGPGAEIAAPLLVRMVRDTRSSEGARRAAIIALGTFESRGAIAIPALSEELVAGGSTALRDAAALALVKVGEEAMPTILRCLDHPDSEVRWRVALNLRWLTDPVPTRVKSKLLLRLEDQQGFVRISAAETCFKLWGISDSVIITAIKSLADRDRRIRFRAKNLLVEMKPLKQRHLDQLRELAGHPKGYVANSARVTLQQLLRED